MSKVLFVGLGTVSGFAIDFLTRVDPSIEIIIASRDLKKAEKKVNEVKVSTAIMDLYPKISFARINLDNVEETACTMKAIAPDVLVNCTVKNNPSDAISRLLFPNNLGYGHFVLWQATLAIKFMEAVLRLKQYDA